MKQIDKVQIKFAGGATPAVIKIARHNLLHATYFTLLWGYWGSDREKREPFRFLTRSNNDIMTHVQQCPPTQTPTRVTMGLIMTRTMIVIRRVTQTHDCKWYRRHRSDNSPRQLEPQLSVCRVWISKSPLTTGQCLCHVCQNWTSFILKPHVSSYPPILQDITTRHSKSFFMLLLKARWLIFKIWHDDDFLLSRSS